MENLYLVFSTSAILLILFFVAIQIRKTTIATHHNKILNLASCIESHKQQIKSRESQLRKYNFIVHNLSQVLVPQASVVCSL